MLLRKNFCIINKFNIVLKRNITNMNFNSLTSKVNVQNPVPSDIEVSQSIRPTRISEIAEAIGILPDEYDMYGSTKAKVI